MESGLWIRACAPGFTGSSPTLTLSKHSVPPMPWNKLAMPGWYLCRVPQCGDGKMAAGLGSLSQVCVCFSLLPSPCQLCHSHAGSTILTPALLSSRRLQHHHGSFTILVPPPRLLLAVSPFPQQLYDLFTPESATKQLLSIQGCWGPRVPPGCLPRVTSTAAGKLLGRKWEVCSQGSPKLGCLRVGRIRDMEQEGLGSGRNSVSSFPLSFRYGVRLAAAQPGELGPSQHFGAPGDFLRGFVLCQQLLQRGRDCAGLRREPNPPPFVHQSPAVASDNCSLGKSAARSGSGRAALPKLAL